MGFELEPWQDPDEGRGPAVGDLAFALVLGALVEMADHAEVAAAGVVDEVDAEGVVRDVEVDILLVQIGDHAQPALRIRSAPAGEVTRTARSMLAHS